MEKEGCDGASSVVLIIPPYHTSPGLGYVWWEYIIIFAACRWWAHSSWNAAQRQGRCVCKECVCKL